MSQRNLKQSNKDQQQILNTLYLLRIIISNTRLYSLEHPKTKEMIVKAFSSLNKTLRTTNKLTILIIDQDIIINNKSIRSEEADYFSLFITVLKQKNIEHLSFKKGITLKELTRFLFDISSKKGTTVYNGPGISTGGLQLKEALRDTLSPTDQLVTKNGHEQTGEREQGLIAKLKSLSTQQQLLAQELYFSIKKEKAIDLRKVQDNMSSFVTLFTKNINPLSLLTTLQTNDDYTFTHVINVCILTLTQAESLGFTGQHLYDIGITATLYDIGRNFIPEELLNKPGILDIKEQNIIKAHTTKGARYLLNLSDAPRLAVLAALEHHIHFDGNGYPDLGSAWKPNIVSQMVAIADTYDSMRCKRPYRKPSSEKIIFNTLTKEKGRSFNPLLVDNFISILSTKQGSPS